MSAVSARRRVSGPRRSFFAAQVENDPARARRRRRSSRRQSAPTRWTTSAVSGSPCQLDAGERLGGAVCLQPVRLRPEPGDPQRRRRGGLPAGCFGGGGALDGHRRRRTRLRRSRSRRPALRISGSGFDSLPAAPAAGSSVSTFFALPPVPPPLNGSGVHHAHSVHLTHCSAQKFPVACHCRIIRMRAPCQVFSTPPLLTLPSGVTAS